MSEDVYIRHATTTNTHTYHTTQDCPNRPRETTVISREQARSRGLSPCRVCTDGHGVFGNTGGASVEVCALCGGGIVDYPSHLGDCPGRDP